GIGFAANCALFVSWGDQFEGRNNWHFPLFRALTVHLSCLLYTVFKQYKGKLTMSALPPKADIVQHHVAREASSEPCLMTTPTNVSHLMNADRVGCCAILSAAPHIQPPSVRKRRTRARTNHVPVQGQYCASRPCAHDSGQVLRGQLPWFSR